MWAAMADITGAMSQGKAPRAWAGMVKRLPKKSETITKKKSILSLPVHAKYVTPPFLGSGAGEQCLFVLLLPQNEFIGFLIEDIDIRSVKMSCTD